ncbi:MAG: SLBB domain-containing protein, partial [Desulfococcus multivorans]|nr:SLBB domain-containing protein [Desulfococcus multivorans]
MRFFLLLLITVLLLPVAGVQAQDAAADLADVAQVTGQFRSISADSVNDDAVEIFFTPSELAIQNEINNKLDLGRMEEELTHFGASYFASLPESLSNLRQTTQFIPSDYRLGVDDVLLIKMRGMQIQDIEETVTREGTIALPNGKRVFVFGSPLPEAEKRIIAEIADLYKNVTVSVEIKKVREFYVSIVGEVKKPGLYLVNGLCQPMDLLLLSGGPTENGSYRKIEYYQSSTGLTLEPQGDASSVKKTIDLYSFFRGGEQQKEFLQPGDKILVPAIGDYISIYGEIKQPAIYEMNDEKTLQDIIHLASSFTPEALQSKIQLKRIDETGFTRIEQLNFNEPADQNFPIENGDVIYIPYNRGFSLNKIYIEGNVWYPGIYNCKPNMKISELLELAGGCLPGSALKLELLRFVSFEKRQIISVPLNEEYFLSPENDLPLENLDILRVFKQSNFIP